VALYFYISGNLKMLEEIILINAWGINILMTMLLHKLLKIKTPFVRIG
jgi:hypothetical protein